MPLSFGELRRKAKSVKAAQKRAIELRFFPGKSRRLTVFNRRLVLISSEIKKLIGQIFDPNDPSTRENENEILQLLKPDYSTLGEKYKESVGKKIMAMQNLYSWRVKESIPVIGLYLSHPQPELRINAINTLGSFGGLSGIEKEKVLKMISKRLKDKEKKVREAASSWIKALSE